MINKYLCPSSIPFSAFQCSLTPKHRYLYMYVMLGLTSLFLRVPWVKQSPQCLHTSPGLRIRQGIHCLQRAILRLHQINHLAHHTCTCTKQGTYVYLHVHTRIELILATNKIFLTHELITTTPVPPILNMQDQVRLTIWQLTIPEACSCKPLIAKLTSIHHTLQRQP